MIKVTIILAWIFFPYLIGRQECKKCNPFNDGALIMWLQGFLTLSVIGMISIVPVVIFLCWR